MVYTTVYVYDDWARPRLYDDFVWWHLMTDHRWSGSQFPEVAAWEAQHPDWRHHEPDRDAEDLAAAAVLENQHDHAYGVDAS